MATSRIQKSFLNNYLTGPGKAFNRGAEVAGHFEQLFMIGNCGATIIQQAYILKDNQDRAAKWEKAANAFGTARDGFNACRFVFPWENLITGKLFYSQYSAKDEKEAILSGNKPWVQEGAWKLEIDPLTNQPKINEKGDYIYVKNDWMDVGMNILILVARTHSPFLFLHSKKAVNLGVHAKRMGGVVIGCWGAILSIGLVQSIRELAQSKTEKEIKLNTFAFAESFIGWVALPSDCGVGMGTPVGSIIGATLNFAYAGVALVRYVTVYK